MRLNGIAERPHRQRGLDAGSVRERVTERERRGAERRAPRNPAELPACRDRPYLAERAGQRGKAADEARRQVGELEAIDRLDDADEQRRRRCRC